MRHITGIQEHTSADLPCYSTATHKGQFQLVTTTVDAILVPTDVK